MSYIHGLYLIFLCFSLCSGIPCPQDASPCKCTEWNKLSTVICRNISGNALRTFLSSRSKGLFRSDVLVVDNGSDVTEDTFSNTLTNSFELTSVTIQNCPRFQRNAKMHSIVLKNIHSQFDYWDWSALCRIRSLTLENLHGLNNFSLGTFQHKEALRTLTVSGCPDLTTLGEESLSSLSGMVTLDLSRNSLVALKRSSLPDGTLKPRLKLLDLSFNHLSSLPDNILSGLTELDLLKLDSNKFLTLRAEMVDMASNNLRYIDFFDNPYVDTCGCSLMWILCRPRVKISVNCRLRADFSSVLEDRLWTTCGPDSTLVRKKNRRM